MGTRKQIAFDLDTKEIQKRYTEADWHNAYRDIKSSMRENGFRHQQGSVYVSEGAIDMRKVHSILDKLVEENKWLPFCTKDITVTNVGKEYNLNKFMEIKCKDVEVTVEKEQEKLLFFRRDDQEIEF